MCLMVISSLQKISQGEEAESVRGDVGVRKKNSETWGAGDIWGRALWRRKQCKGPVMRACSDESAPTYSFLIRLLYVSLGNVSVDLY